MKREIKQHWLILDCETGGLNPLENPVTEIAMIAVDKVDFRVVNQWETLIKPYAELVVTKEALENTGMTMSDINGGRPINKVVDIMIQFLENITPSGDRGRNKPLIVGHNVGFDIRFITKMFELADKQLIDYVDSSVEDIEGKKPREGYVNCLDTLRLSRELWKDEGKFTLSDCCRRIGVDHIAAHRAMPDVIATSKLFRYIIDKMIVKKVSSKAQLDEDEETRKVDELLNAFEF